MSSERSGSLMPTHCSPCDFRTLRSHSMSKLAKVSGKRTHQPAHGDGCLRCLISSISAGAKPRQVRSTVLLLTANLYLLPRSGVSKRYRINLAWWSNSGDQVQVFSFQDFGLQDPHFLQWSILCPGLDQPNSLHDSHATLHSSEDCVLAI